MDGLEKTSCSREAGIWYDIRYLISTHVFLRHHRRRPTSSRETHHPQRLANCHLVLIHPAQTRPPSKPQNKTQKSAGYPLIFHSSSRPLVPCFDLSFELPPNKPVNQDIPGIDKVPAGGYSLPLTVTLGVQVHHWSSGTLLSADGMCWPQPRQVAFAIGCF